MNGKLDAIHQSIHGISKALEELKHETEVIEEKRLAAEKDLQKRLAPLQESTTTETLTTPISDPPKSGDGTEENILEWMKTNMESMDVPIPKHPDDTLPASATTSYDTYKFGWSSIFDYLRAESIDLKTGKRRPGSSLARTNFMLQLQDADAGGQLWESLTAVSQSTGPRYMSAYRMATLDGKRISMPQMASYSFFRASVLWSIFASIYTDTEAIIETGCGFGRNINDLISHGLPLSVHIYCLEFTPSGRNAARLALHTFASDYTHTVLPFNYLSPDFGPIKGKYKRVTVYSVASIEQVAVLPDSYLERILELADKVDGVHMEPIGWQMRDELRMPTRHGPQKGNQDTTSHSKTNTNWWPMLRTASTENGGNRVVMDEANPDIAGWGWSDWGVYSLIRWHKRLGAEVDRVQEFLSDPATPAPDTGSIGGPCGFMIYQEATITPNPCGTIMNVRTPMGLITYPKTK